MRGKTKKVFCKQCGRPFIARVADLNRGWGIFCSKSCKAKYQYSKTESIESVRDRKYLVTGFTDLKPLGLKIPEMPKLTSEELVRELERSFEYRDGLEKLLSGEYNKKWNKNNKIVRTVQDDEQKRKDEEALRKMCEEAESLIS